MKIGFLLPANFAIGNPANGVRAQANYQADALSALGHEVKRLSPWDVNPVDEFDILQFFQGGFANHGIGGSAYPGTHHLVFAPIIDSNESNRRYRVAAKLGTLFPKLFSIPAVFKMQCHDSDLVVCRSTHERERIVDGLGVDPDKTKIVLNGVNPPANYANSPLVDQLGLPERFILHVSAYTQERKNVLRMAEAIGPTGIPLVIAGINQPGDVMRKLLLLAKKHKTIRLLDYLDSESLNTLYQNCEVFCLPSLHEGTGLAALEAAAYGAKIVITQNGGPPDYFENMAHYVDPNDTHSIRQATLSAWNAAKTPDLKEHVLKNLTWEQSAISLIKAYQAVGLA